MSERQPPDEILKQFDSFDLENMPQRRLATYALRDFYGTKLSKVGQEYLHFDPELRKDGPKKQWNKVKTRFEAIDNFSVPSEFSGLPYQINTISNEVDHDYDKNPPVDRLRELRNKADDWANWLTDQGERYREVEGELDARETIIRIIRQSIEYTITSPDDRYREFEDEQRGVNTKAEELREELEEIIAETDGITNELVYLLSDAKGLEKQENLIEEGEYWRDWEAEIQMEERRIRERESDR
ncbi:hypothetical protein [Halorubrum sp. FL23]|uniref:hypothetical protein n=1 Tax=Halorubrum sp. FL23 TaxID=3458704 RepID=UPI004034BF34